MDLDIFFYFLAVDYIEIETATFDKNKENTK